MIAFAVLLFSLTAAVGADEREGRLSDDHRRWLNEDVVYIILEKERDVFLDLESEEQRDLFVEAFWAKRDPYPATLENEYQTEHYRRVEHANEYFSRDAPMPAVRVPSWRFPSNGKLVCCAIR